MARRVPHPDAPGLEALVGDDVAFIERSLFRQPLITAVDDVAAVTSADHLWTELLTGGIRPPFFRLVRDGATLPAQAHGRRAGVGHRTIDDVIQPNRVLELHDEGATVVLQGLQLTDPHLAKLSNNLALALDHPVQVNAYLSPPAARGLELHFDLHDVFVLQLEGAKRWRVWDPLERTRDPVRGMPRPAPLTFDELGEPRLDLTLRTGDCLYLPRGHPHAAETVEVGSAHLTIGILAVVWQRALRAALDAAVAEGAWRTSIVPGTVPDAHDVVRSLRPHLEQAAMRRWMVKEVWRRQPATRLRPRHEPEIASSTRMDLTPGPLVWLERTAGRAVLGLGDRVLSMPEEAHGFLAEVLGAPGPWTTDDLGGGLDAASKSVIARRLATEGVVAPG